jgi:hypothetical protein
MDAPAQPLAAAGCAERHPAARRPGDASGFLTGFRICWEYAAPASKNVLPGLAHSRENRSIDFVDTSCDAVELPSAREHGSRRPDRIGFVLRISKNG